MSAYSARTISPITVSTFYFALMALALFLTMKWRYPAGLHPEAVSTHWEQFAIVFVIWVLVYFSLGLFEIEKLRGLRFVILGLVSAAGLNFISAVVYFYVQPELLLTPRRFLLVLVLILSTLLFFANVLYLWYLRRFSTRFISAFGSSQFVDLVNSLVNSFSHLGFKFVGHYSKNNHADVLLYPPSQDLSREDLTSLYQMRTRGSMCVPFAMMYEQLWRKVYLPGVGEGWLLEVVNISPPVGYRAVKRLIDLVIGGLASIFYYLTFPFIALLIKLDSPGPVFFSQSRIGFRGQQFFLKKYRTMRHDARHDTWTQTNDPRITRIGAILRKLRFDELPQAVLVMKGQMSLVGPRPEQAHIVEQLRNELAFYDERHWAKPGLTGWAQLHVYAATVEETREKLAYDLYYLKHQSAGLDAEVILKTVWRIIFAGGV